MGRVGYPLGEVNDRGVADVDPVAWKSEVRTKSHLHALHLNVEVARGVDIVRVLHGARDIRGILAEEFGVEPEE